MTDSGASAVCVIGAPRSGTSLTTRVLGLLGAYLGPSSAMRQPADGNPRGYWEHRGLMRLNHRVLEKLGGSWRAPLIPEPGWEKSAELGDERAEARTLIAETFGDHSLWAWKDASVSLTLPFWQELIPNMRYVICLRNPVDVAASALRRGFGFDESIGLWLQYMGRALVGTAGMPRLVVPYTTWIDDWWSNAEYLSMLLDRPSPSTATKRSIEGAIDDQLQHHRTPAATSIADQAVPRRVGLLHLMLAALASSAPASFADGSARGFHAATNQVARRLLSDPESVA